MALPVQLCSNCPKSFVSSVSPSSSSSSISPLSLKRTDFGLKSCLGALVRPQSRVERIRALIVKASSDNPDGSDDDDARPESDDDEDVLVQDLPLDAKLQNKLEKKLKMKVAKKIRLRRKKLIHKRRLRKKGRWPPSKMKKLSNV